MRLKTEQEQYRGRSRAPRAPYLRLAVAAKDRVYPFDMGLAIDGTPIPDTAYPEGLTQGVADLDISAERTGDGMLHRERVRQGVCTVGLRYVNIGRDMCTFILGLLEPEKFKFTFFDKTIGKMRTGDFYVGDRDSGDYWLPAGAPESGKVVNLSFNVIEY